jgi:hypothetical protein
VYEKPCFEQNIVQMWLSVDPLSDKFPGISPYAYCYHNPINYTDPWGLAPDGGEGAEDDYVYRPSESSNSSDQDWGYYKSGETSNSSKINIDLNYSNNRYSYTNSGLDITGTLSAERELNRQRFLQTSPYLNSSGNTTNNGEFSFTPYVSPLFGATSELVFSEKFNSWMGKDFKLRSQDWGGNGITGGKFKFARSTSRYFKWAGALAGLYGVYDIESQYRNNQINQSQRVVEQISNGIGFIPIYGTSWSIGWGLGKYFGPSTWYGSDDNQWFE